MYHLLVTETQSNIQLMNTPKLITALAVCPYSMKQYSEIKDLIQQQQRQKSKQVELGYKYQTQLI